jgi:hypothetical protein
MKKLSAVPGTEKNTRAKAVIVGKPAKRHRFYGFLVIFSGFLVKKWGPEAYFALKMDENARKMRKIDRNSQKKMRIFHSKKKKSSRKKQIFTEKNTIFNTFLAIFLCF